jgi:hypothetical protein
MMLQFSKRLDAEAANAEVQAAPVTAGLQRFNFCLVRCLLSDYLPARGIFCRRVYGRQKNGSASTVPPVLQIKRFGAIEMLLQKIRGLIFFQAKSSL